jgi:hypothetical protein
MFFEPGILKHQFCISSFCPGISSWIILLNGPIIYISLVHTNQVSPLRQRKAIQEYLTELLQYPTLHLNPLGMHYPAILLQHML